jgi:hypothetical protein
VQNGTSNYEGYKSNFSRKNEERVFGVIESIERRSASIEHQSASIEHQSASIEQPPTKNEEELSISAKMCKDVIEYMKKKNKTTESIHNWEYWYARK